MMLVVIPLRMADSIIDARVRSLASASKLDEYSSDAGWEAIAAIFEGLPVDPVEIAAYLRGVRMSFIQRRGEKRARSQQLIDGFILQTLATGVMLGAAEPGDPLPTGLVSGDELDAAMAAAGIVTAGVDSDDLNPRVQRLVDWQVALAYNPEHLSAAIDELRERGNTSPTVEDAEDLTLRSIVGSSFSYGISVGMEIARAREQQ